MSKHKFKAKPFNKEKFLNKIFPSKEVNDFKMEDSNSPIKINTLEETDESRGIFKENKDYLAKENFMSMSIGNALTKLHKARSISKDRKSNENFIKKSKNSKNNSKENHVFKAKPMPNFTLKELKKISINLTCKNPLKSTDISKSDKNLKE